MKTIAYLDKKGNMLFVSSGISDEGRWSTFCCKPNGEIRRVKSPELPRRENVQDAHKDLHEYAKKHKRKPLG